LFVASPPRKTVTMPRPFARLPLLPRPRRAVPYAANIFLFQHQATMHSSCLLQRAAVATFISLSFVACATSNVDAQWRSTETPNAYLRGATVLVSCEAGEAVLRRICEDRVMADLSARGVRPVLPEPGTVEAMRPGVADVQYLTAARASGAKAVFSVTVGVASQSVNPGMSVSIGGFGFGGHSAGGVGVSAPIGGGQVSAGYAANGRVTDVASGRLMWTARASTPPSSDANAQIAELSKAVFDAAGKAGLF
jgi:hypothetical protein